MALLTGMTADGLEVPVQVQPDGKLVAEGLEGRPGTDGVAAVIGGTAALPGLHPPGDENTGLYSPNPNELGFSTDGIERLRINSLGNILIGATAPRADWFNANRSLDVLIERASQFATAGICLNADSMGGPAFVIGKTRGTTLGGKSIVLDGDNVGKISYQASNGINLVEVGQVRAIIDGPTSATAVPASIVFQTSGATGLGNETRMRLKSSGVVNIAYVAVHADNAAALAAGLVHGDTYRHPDGAMMIVY